MSDVVHSIALHDSTVRFRVAAASDVGAVRKINEDSFLVEPPVFVVADGMGGHSFGDRASREAVTAFAGLAQQGSPVPVDALLDTIKAANDAVVGLTSWAGPGRTISGTTLTGIALVESSAGGRGNWLAFNVGDSRVYRHDETGLTQISVDHSVVQELVDAGTITAAESAVHPERNVVTRALGATEDVSADVWLLPVGGAQRFLLCSDGLTKELDDREIARLIEAYVDGEETLAQLLVRAAIAAGGSDNVTAVVIDVEPLEGELSNAEETRDRASITRSLEETRPRL